MTMARSTWFSLAVLIVVVVTLAGLMALTGCSKPAAPGGAVSPARTTGAVYTCPMHPEVTSGRPGECTKCHMALVKKGN